METIATQNSPNKNTCTTDTSAPYTSFPSTALSSPPRLIKKHRISDDEKEGRSSEEISPPSKMQTAEIFGANEADLEHTADYSNDSIRSDSAYKIEDMDAQERSAALDKALDDEESFITWLNQQKSQGIRAAEMLDVLGLSMQSGLSVDEEELWGIMLSMGAQLIQPSIPSRQKLGHVNTIENVVDLLREAKKIVVLAGAGISVSCGIPDFRSENGIYSRLGEYNLPNPQCMFDIDFFRSNPKPFFAFAKELLPKANGMAFTPSNSHYFLKLLQDKGKLLRVYSQNIDMLEHAAGISDEHCILCHGSFATATCLACKKQFPNSAIWEDIHMQKVPMCSECNAEEGIIKPDIVFFGESLPKRFHDSIRRDEKDVDLVLVMGSSLKVNPVRSLIGRIKKSAPMILINREPVGRPHKFDVELLGYSDDIVRELCARLEWDVFQPSAESECDCISYAFHPPNRYMFDGAKAVSCSSSEPDDDEDDDDEDEEYVQNEAESEEEHVRDDCRAQAGESSVCG